MHLIKYCSFFIILFSCSGNYNKQISFKYKEIEYQFSLNDLKNNIKFEDIPRTVPYKGDALIRLSNSILNDSIIVLKNFKPLIKKLNSINWKENPFKNDTWQLYYENLLFVSSLNHAHVKTIDKKAYHKKAKLYIEKYIKLHENKTFSSSKFFVV